MSFNPNLPADDTYISSVASILRTNFNAIAQGSTSFSPLCWNLTSIDNAEEPQATDTQSRTFLKKDNYGNLNIFTALPNAQSGAFAQTLLPPVSFPVTLQKGTLTLQYTSLLGGFLLAFGQGINFIGNTLLHLEAFTSVSCILASRRSLTDDPTFSHQAIIFTPVSKYTVDGKEKEANPENTFMASVSTSIVLWNCHLLVIGIPDPKFLEKAFSTSGA